MWNISGAINELAAREVAAFSLRRYKIDQSLYKDYGGRVIFQQFGPEPLDAYRRILEEAKAKRRFVLLDRTMENDFWNYFTNESMHSFFPEPEAKIAMTEAWWLMDKFPGHD
jgi:hypothetical protein